MEIKRGDLILVSLDPVVGSEQGKTRPAVVIQNDIGNKYSSTTIIAPLISKIFSKEYPINVIISKEETGLKTDSTALLNQIRTIDKRRIIKKLASVGDTTLEKINSAIKISLSLK